MCFLFKCIVLNLRKIFPASVLCCRKYKPLREKEKITVGRIQFNGFNKNVENVDLYLVMAPFMY